MCDHPSWSAAVAADAAGDLIEAIELYSEALSQLSEPRLATATARLSTLRQLHAAEEPLRAGIALGAAADEKGNVAVAVHHYRTAIALHDRYEQTPAWGLHSPPRLRRWRSMQTRHKQRLGYLETQARATSAGAAAPTHSPSLARATTAPAAMVAVASSTSPAHDDVWSKFAEAEERNKAACAAREEQRYAEAYRLFRETGSLFMGIKRADFFSGTDRTLIVNHLVHVTMEMERMQVAAAAAARAAKRPPLPPRPPRSAARSASGTHSSGETPPSTPPRAGPRLLSRPASVEMSEALVPSSKRDHVVLEILSKEQSFIKSLEALETHVLTPLASPGAPLAALLRKEGITSADLRTIFAIGAMPDFNTLIHIGRLVLNEVMRRIGHGSWSSNSSNFADMFSGDIGALLRKFPAYCARYRAAESRLAELKNASPPFAAWLQQREAAASVNGCCFSIDSALIRPLQKVPQFCMLLRELKKRTAEEHPDRENVEKALAEMLALATECNDRVRASIEADELQETIDAFGGGVRGGTESRRKLTEILALSRVMPRIVKRGTLLKRNRRERWESLAFFLFSSGSLVYAKEGRTQLIRGGRCYTFRNHLSVLTAAPSTRQLELAAALAEVEAAAEAEAGTAEAPEEAPEDAPKEEAASVKEVAEVETPAALPMVLAKALFDWPHEIEEGGRALGDDEIALREGEEYAIVNMDEGEEGEEEGYWLVQSVDETLMGLVPKNHLEIVASNHGVEEGGGEDDGADTVEAGGGGGAAAEFVVVAPSVQRRLTTVTMGPTNPRRQWVFVVVPNRDVHIKWVGELTLCAQTNEEMHSWLDALSSVEEALTKKRDNLRERSIRSATAPL